MASVSNGDRPDFNGDLILKNWWTLLKVNAAFAILPSCRRYCFRQFGLAWGASPGIAGLFRRVLVGTFPSASP